MPCFSNGLAVTDGQLFSWCSQSMSKSKIVMFAKQSMWLKASEASSNLNLLLRGVFFKLLFSTSAVTLQGQCDWRFLAEMHLGNRSLDLLCPFKTWSMPTISNITLSERKWASLYDENLRHPIHKLWWWKRKVHLRLKVTTTTLVI